MPAPRSPARLALAALLLSVRAATSARVDAADHEAQDAGSVEGCLSLKNTKRGDDLFDQTPPEVLLTVKRHDLLNEYRALTDTLQQARKGKLGNWKCSSLYRSMYVMGYEKAFAAKHVGLYLTKEGTKVGSKIKVCFVDRTQSPESHVPANVYSDGKVLQFKHGLGCADYPTACKQLGDPLPAGVYGLVYDGFPILPSDKSTLPVDLLKLLEAKGMLHENMEMAALINSGGQSGFAAAKTVGEFRHKFKAKGLNIFYAQKSLMYNCGFITPSSKTCREWHHWFEYVDLSVAAAYTPVIRNDPVAYPQEDLDVHYECLNGDTRMLAKRIAPQAGQKDLGKCGAVAGATLRDSSEYPNCKCKGEDQKVFCGADVVHSRKFNMESVLSLKGCDERRAYCSSKPCRPPSDPADQP